MMFQCTKEFFCKDIIKSLKDFYEKISDIDKKTFLWIFVALNLMFLFHTISFLFGNHDWWAIRDGVQWGTFFFNGRFSATSIKMILLNGQVLPIINNLLAFFFYSLGVVLILNYWNAPKILYQRLFIGFALTLTPFTNVWLWYAYHSIENLSIPFFVVLGLILAIRQSKNIYFSIIQKVFSVFFLDIALGIYPSAVVNILTLFSCKFLSDSLSDGLFRLKQTIMKHKWSFINIALSFFTYKMILVYMKYRNLLADIVNIKSANFRQIIENTGPAFKASIQQIFNYKFICMPQSITNLFAVLFVVLLLLGIYKVFISNISKKDKLIKIVMYPILFSVPLIASKFAAIIALKDVAYSPRIDIYGLVFLRGMVVLLLFKYGNNWIKNVTYIILFVILWISMIANFVCQKSLYFAHTSEFMRANRMLHELRVNENYMNGKKYKLIAIGYPTPLRLRYIPNKYKNKVKFEVSLGSHTLTPEWSPFAMLEFFTASDFIKETKVYLINEYSGKVTIDTLGAQEKEILRKVLPEMSAKDSENIKIIDDTIICVFSEKTLKQLREEHFSSNNMSLK